MRIAIGFFLIVLTLICMAVVDRRLAAEHALGLRAVAYSCGYLEGIIERSQADVAEPVKCIAEETNAKNYGWKAQD